MNKIYRCFTMLLVLFTGVAAYAQNRISGTVLDDAGYPLPGTSVLIEGSSTGTITDVDGKYTINAAKGTVLLFDFIGFEPQRIAVGDKAVL